MQAFATEPGSVLRVDALSVRVPIAVYVAQLSTALDDVA